MSNLPEASMPAAALREGVDRIRSLEPSVLSCTLRARDRKLTLQAVTNFGKACTTVGTALEGDWAVTLPFPMLSTIAAAADSDITLKREATRVVVAYGKNRAALNQMIEPPLDLKPLDGDAVDIACSVTSLLNGLKTLALFVSKPNRNILQYICISGRRLIACDGDRLAWMDLDGFGVGEAKVVFGSSTVPVARRMEPSSFKARVTNQRRLELSDELGWVEAPLIAGEYPDLESKIPNILETEMEVIQSDLANALRGVDLFPDGGTTRRMRLDMAPGLLTLSTDHPEYGRVESQVEATFTGEPTSYDMYPHQFTAVFGALNPSDIVRVSWVKSGATGVKRFTLIEPKMDTPDRRFVIHAERIVA